MRVLAISFVFPNASDPTYGIFVFNRLKAVSKYCDVKVINPVPWFPLDKYLKGRKKHRNVPKKEIIEGIEVLHPRFFSIPRYFKVTEAISYFAAVLPIVAGLRSEYPFDLIDLHWPYPDLPTGRLLARTFGKKQVITLRGKEALFSNGDWIFRKVIIPLIQRSDAVISLSNELAELCVVRGVSREKICVIRNGVDSSLFRFLEKTICRKKLGIPLNKRVILSVGALIFRKGHDRIIKALPKILSVHPDVILYIIGSGGAEGDYTKELIATVEENSIASKVNFVGHQNNADLVFWYNAADIFCLASRGEGSPNVLSEALACGCPSLATNVGSVPEILSEKFMGEIVENKDEAIVPALLSMLDRKYDRKKIANHMKQYDWDWCARKVIKVYKSVLRNGS